MTTATTATERADAVTAMLTTMDLPTGAVLVTNADDFATELANNRHAVAQWTLESATRDADPLTPVVQVVVKMPMASGGLFVSMRVLATESMTSWAARRLAALVTELAGLVDCLENAG